MEPWDEWSHDEFWRAENPGLSAARGWLIGMGVSLLLWAVFFAVVAGMVFLFG